MAGRWAWSRLAVQNYSHQRAGLRSAHRSVLLKFSWGGGARRTFQTSSQAQSGGPGPKLTPLDVSAILRQNEFTLAGTESDPNVKGGQVNVHATLSGAIKAYDMNTLNSNSPTEDAHTEALQVFGKKAGALFGIFDGHGGAACGQVVAKRLFNYVAAILLSPDELLQHLEARKSGDTEHEHYHVVNPFHEVFELVADLQRFYESSYIRYLEELAQEAEINSEDYLNRSMEDRLKQAFRSLDDAMSEEAIQCRNKVSKEGHEIRMKTLSVALSGAVATLAHIQDADLHVASCGDVTAVLGSLSENETWVAKKLTVEHNADNPDEVARIASEHPGEPIRDIMRGDRLLGILAPVRAMGDFKFKWPSETIEACLAGMGLEHQGPPQHYKSPPYLTCEPDVIHHRLTPKDKFLVIGSDGLWDMMTPMQVIRLVGEHMSGKVTLSPLQFTQPTLSLGEIKEVLVHRQAAMKLKPMDSNAATHLIRNALGGSAYGVDHDRLVQMLTLPKDMVRMFRDDITVTVIFFDTEYLRHC
ncbi:hypothetical protein TCAL_06352 [Tigriopus californicus]|uniref:PPM-type phosphatase domain-containing protein n=1 Tax=Tigriopus californicus TaxID=6832 RepID=A0A553PAA8_TIGCA|nr:pyruvate dehydrogenase [acetyl-transferring]-phosphatase 1, mitochondrial-like [Tigriopus californicus]TRY74622.1 hypothetical protein TCAL_06352 [Tigriopus californicus]